MTRFRAGDRVRRVECDCTFAPEVSIGSVWDVKDWRHESDHLWLELEGVTSSTEYPFDGDLFERVEEEKVDIKSEAPKEGAWVVWESGSYGASLITSIHALEIDALRIAVANGTNATFLEYGDTFNG